jgi:hypothetical protein
MVEFTTAIIFQYVYLIPQKAKSFAITYFFVAFCIHGICYRNCVVLEHWIPVIYWNQTHGSILHVIQPQEGGRKRDKALELYAGKLWITLKIRKPFNLKTWKQKSVKFGFMIRPLINPLNICWSFDINTLIPMISLYYFKSPLLYPDHTLIFNRMKRPKSKLECDLFFNLILIGFENQQYF